MLLAVAALLLRPLEARGGLLFAQRLQLDGLRVVQFVHVRHGVVRRFLFLFLTGLRADLLVDFGFELEAAFQSAAAAGDVLRIQRKSLLLRHFHVDAVEAVEEFRAAERAAAGADAAENGRFVAHADLP